VSEVGSSVGGSGMEDGNFPSVGAAERVDGLFLFFFLLSFRFLPFPLLITGPALLLLLASGVGRGSFGRSLIDLLYMKLSVIATAWGLGFLFFDFVGGGLLGGAGGGLEGFLSLPSGVLVLIFFCDERKDTMEKGIGVSDENYCGDWGGGASDTEV